MESPGLRGAHNWSASFRVPAAMATQHHALPVVATRLCADGCSLAKRPHGCFPSSVRATLRKDGEEM